MSESMSSPWIRDYLVGVAQKYGAQLYNAPVLSGKKKVQLTDFLTYQENSYVWAWISDKDHRVSVRISKDAASLYKSNHCRNIVDCRFSVVVISGYRPMFSPRPLGLNMTGNTPVSHISLEIAHVRSVGIGGHLFGNPRDLESDDNMKEWVSGLRQDGGGGNVLKLRKQQELAQNESTPPSPPAFSLYAPVSQCPAAKAAEETPQSKLEQPPDFRRAYTKFWRETLLDSWKFAADPALEELHDQYPIPVCRTPSPIPRPQRQGTPTDWSLSNGGSPVVPDKIARVTFGNEIQRRDEAQASSDTPHLPSEGHATVDAATATDPDTHSPQPPTPAQRTKHSPPPPSASLTRNSPEACISSYSQQLACSSPPPPTSPLSLPFSSLPTSINIRKNIQRKVPHPGFPAAPPDHTKQGPIQILVPNSDTSGTGSSQPHPESQPPSQSQRLFSHSPAFPSSLPKDFRPPDASTPREGWPGSSTRRTSKMSTESLPTQCAVEEQEAAPIDNQNHIEKADSNAGKREGLDSTRSLVPSVPKVEVLEVRTSDTEEDTHGTSRAEAGFDTRAQAQDTGKVADQDNRLPVNKTHSTPESRQPRRSSKSCLSAASLARSDEPNTVGVSIRRPGSQSSMHSLFSEPSEDEGAVPAHGSILPVERTVTEAQGPASSPHVSRHDSEAWKEPSFLARNKGKGKARAVWESDTSKVKMDRKRQRSAQPESPLPKRTNVAAEVRQVGSDQTTAEIVLPQNTEVASSARKKLSSHRSSASLPGTSETGTSSTSVQLPKPRLVNFVVDFERVDLGRRMRMPMVNIGRDVRYMLLRTGRIRTQGKVVEKDGRAYIMR